MLYMDYIQLITCQVPLGSIYMIQAELKRKKKKKKRCYVMGVEKDEIY